MNSLKTRILITVISFIVVTGLLVSFLVTQRYSEALREALYNQGLHEAKNVSVAATDQILINDLVALQKSIDRHLENAPYIGYIFVSRDNHILAHSFPNGVPETLIGANRPAEVDQPGYREIVSLNGERFLDIAFPVFDGKAGVLRLGLSEKHYRDKLKVLWIEIALATLLALCLALAGVLILVRYVTRPLASLVDATRQISGAALNKRVAVDGPEETRLLAESFNEMLGRIEDHHLRQSEQSQEISRAHEQARTSCQIVQEVGALKSLKEINQFLLQRFDRLLRCREMILLILGTHHKKVHVIGADIERTIEEPDRVKWVAAAIETLKDHKFTQHMFEPPLVPEHFLSAQRQAVVPIRYGELTCGALVIACPGSCPCHAEEIEVIQTILSQSAGSIRRAILYDEELNDLDNRTTDDAGFHGLVGKDSKMKLIFKLIADIAPTESTVLIQSESGTGKELVARAIHDLSTRSGKPFVVINCSAYPSTLLESELFGHEKGAFTGAIKQRPGRFEQAHEGTVFLDEIGEIPLSAQIKLLRVVQTQQFERLGGNKTITVNTRIIAATNKDLSIEVREGRFREDLYYRINVIPVHLPPLRERLNDLPYLVRYFYTKFAPLHDKKITGVAPEAMRLLMDYQWPGNVRELENAVEHAVVLCRGDQIIPLDLPAYLRGTPDTTDTGKSGRADRDTIMTALEESGWNKKKAAKKLGISRSTLYDWLKKHNIGAPSIH